MPRLAVCAVYLSLLVFLRDEVPAGLANDAAEEALRGRILLDQRRLEPITNILGYSAETLYLYVVGASATIFGSTTIAIQLVSWICALITIAFTAAAYRRLTGRYDVLPLVLSSVWLFHYARSGLRAISAPMFLAMFLYWYFGEKRRDAIAAGIVMGLGLYGYTSFRIVPVAWLIDAIRRRDFRRQAWIAAAALLVSIPNLLYFTEFVSRGSYVMRGGVVRNTIETALLPLRYDNEHYDGIIGEHHYFDGISAALTRSGINPIHPIVGVLFFIGLFRRREGILILLLAAALAFLGPWGPSATRLLVILPVVLICAAFAFAQMRRELKIAIVLLVVGTHGYGYFQGFRSDGMAQSYFSPASTPIGKRARELAAAGEVVVCVIRKDANVVRYLTYDVAERVRIAEFHARPFAVEQVPMSGADVLLVESQVRFASLYQRCPNVHRGVFRELRCAQ